MAKYLYLIITILEQHFSTERIKIFERYFYVYGKQLLFDGAASASELFQRAIFSATTFTFDLWSRP